MPTAKKQLTEPVVVSKGAYAALRLLKRDSDAVSGNPVRFPEIDGKNAFINELYRAKKVINKVGERMEAKYSLLIPFEQVEESQRKTKDLGAPKSQAVKSQVSAVNPVSRGGHLSTLQVLADFVKKADAEVKDIHSAKAADFKKRISDIKQTLAKTNNDEEEHLLIQELGKANAARRQLGLLATIEAVKNTAALSEFKWYDFGAIVSVNPADYENE